MLSPQRRKRILALALPIIGGMVSQNVLNLVDTAMVGVLGPVALAAVGIASFAHFMSGAFIQGLSSGVQAVSSRRLGEGKLDETAAPLNGGLLLALVLGVPWAVLLFVFADRLFPYLVNDPDVVAEGIPYLRARFAGMVAVGLNYSFRGYWNGVNQSRLYMRTLIIMHVCNIVFNWVLIFGHFGFPALGTTGAGIGSALATWVGTASYVYLGFKHARGGGFLKALPDRQALWSLIRLSTPTGIQNFFFASGLTAFFWIVGRVGTAELAASNVLTQLLLVGVLPALGFGLASASLVGQALGRGDPEDARRWGWDVSRMAALSVSMLAIPGLLFPDLILGGFLHDEATLALARLPLRLLALTIVGDSVGTVLMNSHLGAGDTRRVMFVSVGLLWGLLLPVAYVGGFVLGGGMLALWGAQVAHRSTQSCVFAWLWHRGRWAGIKL